MSGDLNLLILRGLSSVSPCPAVWQPVCALFFTTRGKRDSKFKRQGVLHVNSEKVIDLHSQDHQEGPRSQWEREGHPGREKAKAVAIKLSRAARVSRFSRIPPGPNV